MKVLLYGGGAREHALAWKLSASSLLTKLYLCRPNDGFAHLGTVLKANSHRELAVNAKLEEIDLLVVGPEDPLSQGIVDEFMRVGIPSIGANKKWAQLESSKSFAKEFMIKHNIPTAKYAMVTNRGQIKETLDKFDLPVVLKADGLAAGKGVSIIADKAQAAKILEEFLAGKYGEASRNVVVEEFLVGNEISLISLWDGKTLLPLIPARDHKRLLDDDMGPNTGGMGAYCPVDLMDEEMEDLRQYTLRLQEALRSENADFTGIIYSGLILTEEGIKVLEYNMRFGDPETQPLMMHLESDLLEMFNFAVNKKLDEANVSWKKGTSLCVVIAAKGYPENPAKGGLIGNTYEIENKYGVTVFYAGVKEENNQLFANGGRVLSLCKTGKNPFNDIYGAANELEFTDKHYRTDIGRTLCRM